MPPPKRRDSKGNGDPVEVTVVISYNEENGHIIIRPEDGIESSVSYDPNSSRYHRGLFCSLADILGQRGVLSPEPDTFISDDPPPPRKKKHRVIKLEGGSSDDPPPARKKTRRHIELPED